MYQTGSATSAGNLQSIIEAFATTNGWSLNSGAGSWLSKGNCHIRLGNILPGAVNSITRSSSTATVVMSLPHQMNIGDSVTISGATQTAYNGTYTILTVTSTNFTYTVSGTPATEGTPSGVRIKGSALNLRIDGANSSDGSTGVCPAYYRINIPSGDWPITYFLHSLSSPDLIYCALSHGAGYYQHIIFGDITKVHASAFTGGNFFFASLDASNNYLSYGRTLAITDTTFSGYAYSAFGAPFQSSVGIFASGTYRGLHCEIDGETWPISGVATANVGLTDYAISSLYRNPNNWNNQVNLIPIAIQFGALSSLQMYLGYMEHVRFVRIDNYEPTETITIGTDIWQVYPCVLKNSTDRNNSSGTAQHSGTIGFAVRKV